MSSWRGNPNIPGNRPRFRSARVPYSPERQNLDGTVAAGERNPIPPPALFSAYSTSTLNAMHGTSAPQAASSSSTSCAAEQHAGPSIPPSWNLPSGCTQVPINIIVFHRRLIGRGSRPQIPLSRSCTPAPALPGVPEDGASIQYAGRNLSLGRASNIVASHMTMDPLQLATPDKSEHAPADLQQNVIGDEAAKTENETEATQLQQSATINSCDRHTTLQSAVQANTSEAQVKHSQESTAILGKGSPHDNIHVYQPMSKRSKRKISQSEHTPLSTPPAVLKERTLSQIETQIADTEKTETFRNEESPAQKLKTRRKKHRPKVIREDRKAKMHKPVDSTPDGKSPNLKVKRSYVRKKRTVSSVEKSSGPVSNQSISGGTEIAAPRTASVRRSLHFGLEEQRAQAYHIPTANSHHHNIENLVHGQSSLCSVTDSEVPVGQGQQVEMENSPGELAFDMSLKLNKMLDEYIQLPEVTPEPTEEVTIATSECFGKELAREQANTNNSSPASTRLPQPCMDALYESSYIKFMTKKRSQKVRPQCPSSIEPNSELINRLSAGSIFYAEHNGPKISEETFHKSSPWPVDNQTCDLNVRCKAPEGSSTSVSTVSYSDYLQGVASKLQHLDLNTEHVHRTEMSLSLAAPSVISFGGIYGMSNALIPYGDGVVVPYERPLQIVKRQRPRAKVDLDFETTRVWNLLMGSKAEPADGTDVEKEKWWHQEREVFQGRANSFIARMRLVQGDRRFSPWKGSVVDSVVGVFLTQNVADHLSSSAFMALAATFPPRSVNNSCKDNTTTQDNGQTIGTSGLGGKSMLDLFHNCVRPNPVLNREERSVNYEKRNMGPKDNASVNELIIGEKYSFDYKTANASVFNQQGTGMEQKAQQMSDFSSVELTTSTEILQEMQFQSEISSSQSVTSGTRQSRLLLSSGIPRNFVGGGSASAYRQLEDNFTHGKSLTTNGTISSEIEYQRLETVAVNGDDVGEPETSSLMMPFCSTIDYQQLDLRNEPIISSTSPNSSSERSGNKTASTALNCPETSTWPAANHEKNTGFEAPDLLEHESLFVMDETVAEPTRKEDEGTWKSGFTSYSGVLDTEAQTSRTKKTRTTSQKNTENFDWDKLHRQKFLNRLVRDHGSIDLEWLRDIPPDSAKLALPAPQDKSLVKSRDQFPFQSSSMQPQSSSHLPRLEGNIHARDLIPENPEPIIEEPASPREEECPETMENDIEDFDEDGEIPTIKLNMEAFAQNLEHCIKESNKELQSDDIAKALVTISSEAASIPLRKLKNVHRLRTEHYVALLFYRNVLYNNTNFQIHILLYSSTKKTAADILTSNVKLPKYEQVPCRTAMRGSFPLNGTYFQVNEVFADHKSSHNPIHVERKQIWSLQRRMVFFGTSVPTIFKGLTTEEIQQCFWRANSLQNAYPVIGQVL
ncbi:hypothetical protein PR202_ga05292 [Eleusine coracana subsp. coracana]|uniref:Demeter RRM-fold domain-containing protein n=1 Tax=Eleusine coracana subsp. coracana TaxID=191504 RepID=A0AAV5BQM6_ELECO|nr:hypothetical protein PR202_ga04839 [Eleusine coracana subsp. coracana]GJM89140.1 hypothetical protein PR202_ga05292 [Eleusine coracana subsp. coracana]